MSGGGFLPRNIESAQELEIGHKNFRESIHTIPRYIELHNLAASCDAKETPSTPLSVWSRGRRVAGLAPDTHSMERMKKGSCPERS